MSNILNDVIQSNGLGYVKATIDGIEFSKIQEASKSVTSANPVMPLANKDLWKNSTSSLANWKGTNAVDIDWNGAQVEENVTINTTGELLSWIKNNAMEGPEGPQGEQGPQGAKGEQGDKGETGLLDNSTLAGLLARIKILESQNVSNIYAYDAAGVAAITDPANANVILTSAEAMNALTTGVTYKELTLAGGEIDNTVTLAATDKITVDGLNISGDKGSINGKITFKTPDLEIKNVSIKNGSTVYNAFEGSQVTNDPTYAGLDNLVVSDMYVDNPSMAHNVINVYTPANNATITIKNSEFNLDVDNSNVLRLANYLNSENVNVVFENVKWTYENVPGNDWGWAGLIIFQPASSDIALGGDLSKLTTWTFTFRNCEYNGEKVTANNFGEHNQVFYLYNVGGTKAITDPTATENGLQLSFE